MAFKKSPFEEAARVMQEESYTSTELKKDSVIIEGINKLQDFKHIFSITTLTNRTAVLFSMARAIGNFWDIKEIDDCLKDLAMMNLSINGKRAEQITAILQGINKSKKGIGEKIKESIRPQGAEE